MFWQGKNGRRSPELLRHLAPFFSLYKIDINYLPNSKISIFIDNLLLEESSKRRFDGGLARLSAPASPQSLDCPTHLSRASPPFSIFKINILLYKCINIDIYYVFTLFLGGRLWVHGRRKASADQPYREERLPRGHSLFSSF